MCELQKKKKIYIYINDILVNKCVNSALRSRQRIVRTETGSQFKVSFERQEKQGVAQHFGNAMPVSLQCTLLEMLSFSTFVISVYLDLDLSPLIGI